MAHELANVMVGNPEKIEFKGVTAQSRGPLLDTGEVDMVIATFTITPERKKEYHFSTPYFTDEVGFLVRKEDKVSSINDLDGKIMGVAQGATTKLLLQDQEQQQGIHFSEYKEFASYPELKLALTAKRVDAFAVDKSILYGYLDDNTEILNAGFSKQEYGVAIKKSNTELAKFVDDQLDTWKQDGTLDKIYKKYQLEPAK